MLKYYKNWFSNYQNADLLQTISLILFVVFFVSFTWYVFSRPKNYYKKQSEFPLEGDDSLDKNSNI